MTTSKPKILTFDVETSPIQAYVWGLWDQNIGLDFVQKDQKGKPIDWTILSYAAKWLGKRDVTFHHTGGRGADKVRDDKELVRELRDLLDESDIVVAQNGKRFDVKKVNARMIQHGIKPPRPYKVIDTMLVAKRYFAFTSQKLKWTSSLLTDTPKDDHKKYPGFELWEACLRDELGAWVEMEKYNKRDVRATEKVYLAMLPWIENHPNMGLFSGEIRPLCPNCGSENVVRDRVRYRVLAASSYMQYRCKDCGKHCRGKEMQTPAAKRRSLLV